MGNTGAVPVRPAMIDIAISVMRNLLNPQYFRARPQQIVGLGHALLGWERLPFFINAVDVEVQIRVLNDPDCCDCKLQELSLLITPNRAMLRLQEANLKGGEPSLWETTFYWSFARRGRQHRRELNPDHGQVQQLLADFLASDGLQLKVIDHSTMIFSEL